MKRTIIFSFLFLSACGGSGSSSPQTSEPQTSVISIWSSGSLVFDFNGASFGKANEMAIVYPDGLICDCQFILSGSEQQGQLMVGACPAIPTIGQARCNVFGGTYDFTRSGPSSVVVCGPNNSTDCGDWGLE